MRIAQGHVGIKTAQLNPLVLNWSCRLTQVDLYNGRKMMVCVCFVYTYQFIVARMFPEVESVCSFICVYRTFNMEDWKRMYSNNDTRTVALPYFWENFDKENYSLWVCEYKYPEELKLIFMTCNLVGGELYWCSVGRCSHDGWCIMGHPDTSYLVSPNKRPSFYFLNNSVKT